MDVNALPNILSCCCPPVDGLWLAWILCAGFILLARWPYFRLPLHGDTGFYVSNATITAKKFRFSEGWNAHYAGASKFLPEWFYSSIYLLFGHQRYPAMFRLWMSFYLALACGVVGWTCRFYLNQDVWVSIAAMVSFSFLSLEVVYQTYFETAEQFEIIPQFLGFGLIEHGLSTGRPVEVLLGLSLWWIDGIWIKLPALGGALVWSAYIVIPNSAWSVPVVAISGFWAVVFIVWQRVFAPSWKETCGRLIGHEKHSGHALSPRSYFQQIIKQLKTFQAIIARFPFVPLLAVVPVCFGFQSSAGLWVYLSILAVIWFFQSASMPYYVLPFQPVMALFAAWGAYFLFKHSPWAWTIFAVFGVAWALRHFVRPMTLTKKEFNQWAYLGHPLYVPNLQNWRLLELAPEIEQAIGPGTKATLFMFGDGGSQLYMILDRSYPTPLVAASTWLDPMHPGWREDLRASFAKRPPDYIFSYRRHFERSTPSDFWPLKIVSIRKWDDGCELFRCARKA